MEGKASFFSFSAFPTIAQKRVGALLISVPHLHSELTANPCDLGTMTNDHTTPLLVQSSPFLPSPRGAMGNLGVHSPSDDSCKPIHRRLLSTPVTFPPV